MKTKLFTIYLLLFTSQVLSWEFGVETADGSSKHYFDYKKIKTEGQYIFYWELIDRISPHENLKTLSQVNYWQADCNRMRAKTLLSINYKKNMAKGENLNIGPEFKDWTYPVPNSILDVHLSGFCDIKKKYYDK